MHWAIRLLLVICAILAGLGTGLAQTGKRVALVIGNAAYKVGPLQNPERDAAAVADALQKKLGFDKVILRKNLGYIEFRAALIEFAREVSGADLGAFYFAGHGTEVGGRNFLIPIDATLSGPAALDVEAIPLDTVLSQLSGVRRLKLVILDACRNNPFALSGAKRSVTRGLARIEPEDNTLIAYAAKDGTTADDGPGHLHSPFTEALLRHIATPRLEINLLFRRIRDDVIKTTSHQAQPQQPHVYASLGAQELYLYPQAAAPIAAAPAPVPSVEPQAEQAWAAVKYSTSISALQEFRRRYGVSNPVYDQQANARIEALRKATAPTPTTPAVGSFSGRWLMNYTCVTRGAPMGPLVGLGFLTIEETSPTAATATAMFTSGAREGEKLGEGRVVWDKQIFFNWKSADSRGNSDRSLTGQLTAPGKMSGSIKLQYDDICSFTAEKR